METFTTQHPDLALIAGALSDPLRLHILDLLLAGPDDTCLAPPHPQLPQAMCPSDLQRKIAITTASKLSYHLSELQRAGLVQEHRQGKRIYYAIQQETLTTFLDMVRHRYIQENTHTAASTPCQA